ncbi:hypothetical protein Patl1_15573 [Pistacia atlantica]|uniref:Uncharacterized protein n=1 Tax=Pistacia atlantica TaxID=434234 RepID=A0ACC1B5S6_9ROSI|nr:hypothetical protein Patl1_15573 [Pistacia atlantica]
MGKSIILYGFATAEQPETIKQFLEKILGEGTVTDVGVQQQEGLRGYAIVHFTTSEVADTIKSLADEHLWYGNSYLKAQDMGEGPKPGHIQHKIKDVKLHFGFQLSDKKFSSLWTQENVSVNFGLGLRKFNFFLSHNSVEYKLQLPYESIRLVELRHLQDKRFIIIQLFGVPRIYSKDVLDQTFFRDDNDVQWIFRKNFPNLLKKPNGEPKLIVERGSTSSCHSDHVPIVSPPEGFNLPFRIMFKINILVQHGCIPRPAIDDNFFRMVEPHRRNVAFVEHALEKLLYSKECCFEPRRWLREQYQKYNMAVRPPMLPAINLSHGLVYMHRVLVTPSKVYFFGPEVVLSGNVLRTYSNDSENFIRVSFVNEDFEKIHPTDLYSRASLVNTERPTRVYQRILSTLRNGIVIGDKKFEFLAFSNSQLKDNSVWMFASRPGLTASEIRERLGDFSTIRIVAKYSTRLGQSFSSSREGVNVDKSEIEEIPDIEVEKGEVKYVFSNGIGKISATLAHMVAGKCGFRTVPSAFPIRYAGYKGVVAVDPTSSIKLSMRPSMSKYKSDNVGLDILEWSKYQPCYLNRQLVILLSTLGVRDYVFEKKQKYVISQLDTILTDPLKAQEALNLMSSGEITHILKDMLDYYSKPHEEPFLLMVLQIFRLSILKDLKTKTRIFIPRGRAMMGCLDETGILKYGQVFVQCSGRQTELSTNSSGRVSNQGRFDLDGDIYFVCWDRDLIPPRQYPPMDYISPPPKILDNEVTIEPPLLLTSQKPEYLLKSLDGYKLEVFRITWKSMKENPYKSRSVIGKLYREVKDLVPKMGTIKSFTSDEVRQFYDLDMEVQGFKNYSDDAFYYKREYDYRLGNLMDYFGISTEGEILSGQIMKMAKSFNKKRDLEGIKLAVKSLIKEVRDWFNKKENESDGPEKVYMKASAWYYVTYHPSFWGRYNEGLNREHFLSFPWCVHDKLLEIKKDRQRILRALHHSSLQA